MRFEYLQPQTIEDAITLLTKYNKKAEMIAGGTDLVVQMRSSVKNPQYLIDITRIDGLSYIKFDRRRGLKIGALTTIRELETSAKLRQSYCAVSQAAGQLGSVAIRNVATLGGNICNAAPSAETAPALIALSAKARIIGPDGERIVPLEDFFVGPGETRLNPGELLVEIQVPTPSVHTKGVYLKHGIRGTIDLAVVGIAVAIIYDPQGETCQDIKIALGAVAPKPMRARQAEETIMGKMMNAEIIEKSAQMASEEARPISDVRASAEYRKNMVKVFVKQAMREIMTP